MEQVKPVSEMIKELAGELKDELVSIRRHIHQHPELSFKEFETSKFVAGFLRREGIEFRDGYVKTGIVATIHGRRPGKAAVLLRGDMDALPINEKNDVPYRSKNEGVMHACGHDVHTTCALGAAIILHRLRNEWEGTVKVMFQPGEEVLPGGANLMIKEGVLDGIVHAVALHVFPSMPAGKVGFREGMYMASTDELYITARGKGGHAAMPADNINPLLIAAELLLTIQDRFMKPGALKGTEGEHIPTVVAFGTIQAPGASNVVPDKVEIGGTFRTMNEKWRLSVHRQLQEIVEAVSAKYGVKSELRIEKGYPVLINDPGFTRNCFSAARNFLGEQNVEELPLRMTAEDFAFITHKVPSCFFRLGTAGEDGKLSSGVHTATFDVDERCIPLGAGLMAHLALNALKKVS